MSEVTFRLSSPPPAGHTLRVGFSDGTNHLFCEITAGYAENTGKRVSFTWKRTF